MVLVSLLLCHLMIHITLHLNNFLHVPSITKNLLSASQFAKDNSVFVEFHSDKCLAKFGLNGFIPLIISNFKIIPLSCSHFINL